ncbi:hypothetical protein EBI01_15870 [Marinomonas rhizomae]|uniref:Uncharacterized protein n=1 Tax=Marinomonas rhizomae TaxID=491948 RepID=A0A366IZ72_9GAMM|nr:hypothetical protein [Marinomonas rhizomae]RBP79440.1 hypothetical protein DFP80_11429 [Marinomonas rhizomae]RNF71367.1 hypothetical protein EBI01_15870 [Marinomonas rhizomae]
MRLRSILVLACCLSLAGCAGGPRGHSGPPFGFLALNFNAGVATSSVLASLSDRYVVVGDRTDYSNNVF